MKEKLTTILITTGIIIWLTIAFFVYTYRYSTTVYIANGCLLQNPETYKDGYSKYRHVNSKLTLILLKYKIFGYYGNMLEQGKMVPVDETKKLIEDGWKMFSKDSLVVIIKHTKKATPITKAKVQDQVLINKITKYTTEKPNKTEKKFLKI